MLLKALAGMLRGSEGEDLKVCCAVSSTNCQLCAVGIPLWHRTQFLCLSAFYEHGMMKWSRHVHHCICMLAVVSRFSQAGSCNTLLLFLQSPAAHTR
jgi:hypothetical protein